MMFRMVAGQIPVPGKVYFVVQAVSIRGFKTDLVLRADLSDYHWWNNTEAGITVPLLVGSPEQDADANHCGLFLADDPPMVDGDTHVNTALGSGS